jgi:hypothetical protein
LFDFDFAVVFYDYLHVYLHTFSQDKAQYLQEMRLRMNCKYITNPLTFSSMLGTYSHKCKICCEYSHTSIVIVRGCGKYSSSSCVCVHDHKLSHRRTLRVSVLTHQLRPAGGDERHHHQ